jgi:hypothetical protein
LSTSLCYLQSYSISIRSVGHVHKILEVVAKNPGIKDQAAQVQSKTSNSNSEINGVVNPNLPNEVPFDQISRLDLSTSTSSVSNSNQPSSLDSSSSKAIELFKKIMPKPIYNNSASIEVLQQAEKAKLIQYEHTQEYPSSGSPILTSEGIKLFNKLHSNLMNNSEKVPEEVRKNSSYFWVIENSRRNCYTII